MVISLSLFLYIYLFLLAIFSFFAFFNLYHMIRFSFWGFTSFMATFIFISAVTIILFISFEEIRQIDWQQTITWDFDLFNIDFGGGEGSEEIINGNFQ